MSLLFFDGFEGGAQVVKPEWSSASVQSSFPRTGTFGMRTGGSSVLTLPTSAATLFMGCAFYATAFVSDGIVTIRSASIDHLTVRFVDTTGLIQIRLGNMTGTILATSTYALPLSQQRHIQIKAIIDDTAGECTVRVDGTTVVTFSGDTKNGGAGSSMNVEQLSFVTGNNNCYIDDLWVCDAIDATATQGRANNTYLGDLRVSSMLPNANGASSQFVGSDGNSTDNYLLVDETTANTTDYVGTSTAGQQDFYGMQDLPANTVNVYGIRAGGYVAKSDAGAAGIRMGIRESGGTITLASSYALSTTWTSTHTAQHFVKPSDSSVWTVSDVNGVQAGVESASS